MTHLWSLVETNRDGFIAACTSLSYLFFGLPSQALKIWRHKSARNVSTWMFVFMSVNATAWLSYGWHIKNWFLIVPNCLSLLCALGIIGLCLRYGKE